MNVFFHIAVVMLLSLSTQVWANPASVSKNTAASERSVAGNARMRIVWVQDMGDGRDVFAQGGNLRLMGLDTGDGQGERVILGTVGNYAKPLITPRGDRVVYTDRIREEGLCGELGRFGIAGVVWGFWVGDMAGSPGWPGVDILWIGGGEEWGGALSGGLSDAVGQSRCRGVDLEQDAV